MPLHPNAPTSQPLSLKKRVSIFFYIRKMKLLEWVRFDSKVAAFGLFCAYWIYARAVCATQGRVAALWVTGKIFRQVNLRWGRTYTTGVLEKAIRREGALSGASGMPSTTGSFGIFYGDPSRGSIGRLTTFESQVSHLFDRHVVDRRSSFTRWQPPSREGAPPRLYFPEIGALQCFA
jgi:hypothetical protein